MAGLRPRTRSTRSTGGWCCCWPKCPRQVSLYAAVWLPNTWPRQGSVIVWGITYREMFFFCFFSNWIEEDFYVLQLCLMVTGMIGMLLNWVLAQSCYFLSCFIIANWCCLLFVSHSRCLCSVVQRSVLSRHPILPADSNSGTTEFGLNSIFSLCNEQWIHACLHGH